MCEFHPVCIAAKTWTKPLELFVRIYPELRNWQSSLYLACFLYFLCADWHLKLYLPRCDKPCRMTLYRCRKCRNVLFSDDCVISDHGQKGKENDYAYTNLTRSLLWLYTHYWYKQLIVLSFNLNDTLNDRCPKELEHS